METPGPSLIGWQHADLNVFFEQAMKFRAIVFEPLTGAVTASPEAGKGVLYQFGDDLYFFFNGTNTKISGGGTGSVPDMTFGKGDAEANEDRTFDLNSKEFKISDGINPLLNFSGEETKLIARGTQASFIKLAGGIFIESTNGVAIGGAGGNTSIGTSGKIISYSDGAINDNDFLMGRSGVLEKVEAAAAANALFSSLPEYADNASAVAAGNSVGTPYYSTSTEYFTKVH